MAWTASIFLAEGFEEIEMVAVADILRRAGIETVLVSTADAIKVKGGHGITVEADVLLRVRDVSDSDILVLPGGSEGVRNLAACGALKEILTAGAARGRIIAAICAAPVLLQEYGLLKGRAVTSHPSVKEKLADAAYREDDVVTDGNLVTSRGAGTAVGFALQLVRMTAGPEKAENIRRGIMCRKTDSWQK